MYRQIKNNLSELLIWFIALEMVLCPALSMAKPPMSGYARGVAALREPPPVNTLPVINQNIHTNGQVDGVSAIDAQQTEDSAAMEIYQNQADIVVNWDSFDVGENASVTFHQENTSWSALNRIWDANPSAIFGQVQGEGRIFLINQNGMIFGSNSRVNAHTLVATSLDMDDDQFKTGTWKQETINLSAENYQENPEWSALEAEIVNMGNIASDGDTPGAIFLVGPKVTNAGTITATGGQVGLVAGTQVALAHDTGTGGNLDRNIRVSANPGEVTNAEGATIAADLGLAGMYGRVVNQDGVIRAVTAVEKNGKIELLATERINTGANSVIDTTISDNEQTFVESFNENLTAQVTLWGLQSTDAETSRDLPEAISLSGKIVAPGADVVIKAQDEVTLNDGSLIDVSGGWIDRMASQLEVQLNSVELSDAFYVRQGDLKGETIYVNALDGATVGHVAGHLTGQELTARERYTQGGSVTIEARGGLLTSGTITMADTAKIDFSGGGYNYAAGEVRSSKVRIGDQIFDISEVPEWALQKGDQLVLVSADEARRLGMSESTMVPAYQEGHDAGSLNLVADNINIRGKLDGSVVRGFYQDMGSEPITRVGDISYQTARGHRVPMAGRLTLGTSSPEGTSDAPDYILENFSIVADGGGEPGNNAIADRILNEAGLGSLSIYANGAVTTASGTRIDLAPDHTGETLAFKVQSASIDHYGEVYAPGGQMLVQMVKTKNSRLGEDRITLHTGSKLVTAGQQRDYTQDPQTMTTEWGTDVLDGGTIQLMDSEGTTEGIVVEEGSVLDVSGGYAVHADGRTVMAGDAGTLNITAPAIVLAGEIRGHAMQGQQGGSLELQAVNLTVENSDPTGTRSATLVPDTLYVTTEQLAQSGFSDITLKSLHSPDLAPDLVLSPSRVKYRLPLYMKQLLGPDYAVTPQYDIINEDALLEASHLAIHANQPWGGMTQVDNTAEIAIDAQASLSVTPGGSIDLQAPTVRVDGRLTALSGEIEMEATRGGLTLGQGSHIDLHGYLRPMLEVLRDGQAIHHQPEAGGDLSLSAKNGTLTIESGAGIDISGAQKTTNNYELAGRLLSREEIAGAAGALSMTAQTIALDGEANINAQTDLAGLKGGDLTWFSTDTSAAMTMDVALLQDLAANGFDAMTLRSLVGIDFDQPDGADSNAALALGRSLVLDAPYLSTQADGLQLGLYAPQVEIQNRYDKYQAVNNNLKLNSFYFDAADSADWSNLRGPGTGAGLTIAGKWLDMEGQVAMDGFETVGLHFSGDIVLADHQSDHTTTGQKFFQKWQGGFYTLADLTMAADRIYPTTDTTFTIQNGYMESGQWVGGASMVIQGTDGNRASGPIYSAGGDLTLRSHNLLLTDAHLAAPMGAITLDAPGEGSRVTIGGTSLVTVNGDADVQYGVYMDGAWMTPNKDNATSALNAYHLVEGVPERAIAINGDMVETGADTLLDVSGGGSIYAYAFEPSISGSADPLQAEGRYVILPDNSVQHPGSAIYVEGVQGLAEGYYSVLDASYAFVPGALILEDLGAADPTQAMQFSMAGDPVALGALGFMGTGAPSSQKHNFAVRSAADVLTEGQFRGAYMTAGDGGRLSVGGQRTTLAGTMRGAGLEGFKGGYTQLSATNIYFGDDPSQAALESLFGDTEELMVLGANAFSGSGFELVELGRIADDLDVFSDALDGRFDLMNAREAATQNGGGSAFTRKIVFQDGTVDARGLALLAEEEITISGNALLNTDELLLATPDGTVNITTAETEAQTSINVQRMGIWAGQYQQNGRVGVSEHLALGSAGNMALVTDLAPVPMGADGQPLTERHMVVSENTWRAFDGVPTVSLVGQSGITVFDGADPTLSGDLELFAPQLAAELSAAGLSQLNDPNVAQDVKDDLLASAFAAENIFIRGIASARGPSYATDTSQMAFQANDTLFIGGGDVQFDGVTDVALGARNDMVFGVGTLNTNNAGLALTAARMVSTYEMDADGAYQVGNCAINSGDGNVTTAASGADVADGGLYAPGGRLAITANRIDHHGVIDMLGGHVALTATGADADAGLFLHTGSRIMARGGAQAYTIADEQFVDVIQGGTVELTSASGRFELAGADATDPENPRSAARVDVSHANEADPESVGYDLIANASESQRQQWADAGHLDGGIIRINTAGSDSVDGSLRIPIMAGELTGHGAGSAVQTWGRGGSFSMDAYQMDVNPVAGLLGSGGFNSHIHLRTRTGDMNVTTAMRAEQIKLVADGGAISIGTLLDASGIANQRTVALYARDNVNLLAGSEINVAGSGTNGRGEIILSSAQGWVNADAGSLMDLSGGDGSSEVTLAAERYITGDDTSSADDPAANDVKINLNGTIRGAQRVVAQARVTTPATGLLDTAAVTTIQGQTATYMANAVANPIDINGDGVLGRLIENLTLESAPGVAMTREERLQHMHLTPHAEVVADGDLNITAANMDFSTWRYTYGAHEETGVLTVRAGGDLNINANIVDSAQDDVHLIFEPRKNDTWSYNLVAGADLTSADPMAVNASATGDMTLGSGRQIYSESGRIALAAGRDMVLGSGVSTYAPTRDLAYNIASYDGDIQVQAGRDVRLTSTSSAIQTASGDIHMAAGRDIDISPSGAAIRTLGRPVAGDLAYIREDSSIDFWFDYYWDDAWGNTWNTWKNIYESAGAWDNIRQIFSLAILPSIKKRYWDYQSGGNIVLQAGGAVNSTEDPRAGWMDLYAFNMQEAPDPDKYAAAYTGSAFSGIGALAGGDVRVSANESINARIGAFGSGDLNVRSHGDIDGRYLVNDGQGHLTTMGNFGQRAIYNGNALLELGKGSLNLSAQGDVSLGTVLNPLVTEDDFSLGNNEHYLYMGYSQQSAVSLTALKGDITMTGESYYAIENDAFMHVLPPHVAITAGRDILIESESLLLAPAANGQLTMAAGRDIRGDFTLSKYANITMSNAAPEMYYTGYVRPDGYLHNPTFTNLTSSWADNGGFDDDYVEAFEALWDALDPSERAPYQAIYDRIQSSQPLHQGDYDPISIRAGRDITGLNLNLPKAAQISAGQDIIDVHLKGQNVHGADLDSGYVGDITALQAGRDILLKTSAAQIGPNSGLLIGGPGYLMVQAGGAIDLGETQGIQSFGQQNNADLPVEGATLMVAAGYDPSAMMDENLTGMAPDQVTDFFIELRDAGLVYSALKRGQIGNPETDDVEDVDLEWVFSLADRYDWAQDPAFSADLQSWLAGYPDYASVDDAVRDDLAGRVIEEIRAYLINAQLTERADPSSSGVASANLPSRLVGIDFDQALGAGRVNMVQSQVVTENSGSIYMLVADALDVGLSAFGDSSEKKSSGINAQFAGDIGIFAGGDINVNESRVMTWYGGDITMWSDYGSINAGKGSKTTVSFASNEKYFDEDLQQWLPKSSPPAVGSGIRLLTHDPDGIFGPQQEADPGDGYLYAPDGDIDAGEAGIKGLGLLVFEAKRVINVQNIEAGGQTIGFSLQAEGADSIGSLSGMSSMNETKSVTDDSSMMKSTQDRFKDMVASMNESLVPKWLAVEVTGFEEEADGDEDKDAGCGGLTGAALSKCLEGQVH